MTTSYAPIMWFTGLSGAGKSTLAQRLHTALAERAVSAELLDGDLVRRFFEGDLGYSRAERILNVKRITFAAVLLAKHGVPVIVANIAPYYEVRDFIRRHAPNYLQIYVKASPDVLRQRDVQGHYAEVEQGALANMVGIDDAYDVPRCPDLVIETDRETVEQSLERILHLCRERSILPCID